MLALVCFFYARFSSASCTSSCFPVQVSKLWNCFGLCFFQEVSLRAETKYIHKTYLWLFTGMRHKSTECILLQSDQLWQTQSLSSYPSIFFFTTYTVGSVCKTCFYREFPWNQKRAVCTVIRLSRPPSPCDLQRLQTWVTCRHLLYCFYTVFTLRDLSWKNSVAWHLLCRRFIEGLNTKSEL